MSRIQILLTALAGVLIVVIFWFLVYSPAQDEIADLEEQIESEQVVQAQLEAQLERLRAVRAAAPEAESRLAFARSIVPDEPSLPSVIRQFQTAGDDSGVTLTSMTASRPTMVDEEVGLADMGFTVQVSGTYFQTVDFLRRLEDPTITPRGVLWQSMNVSRAEDAYPDLSITLGGSLFTMSTSADIPAELEEPAETPLDPDADGTDVEDGTPEDPTDLEEEDGA